jgi:hypothetical protein
MEPAAKLAILAAGVFFLNGLLTGVWKYLQIRRSPEARAHPYVDVAHRASLLYAFAALLLARFVELSPWSPGVELAATAAPLLFFALAIATYMVHGVLADTENQFHQPRTPALVTGFMAALIVAEIAGFTVLFWGFVSSQLL